MFDIPKAIHHVSHYNERKKRRKKEKGVNKRIQQIVWVNIHSLVNRRFLLGTGHGEVR